MEHERISHSIALEKVVGMFGIVLTFAILGTGANAQTDHVVDQINDRTCTEALKVFDLREDGWAQISAFVVWSYRIAKQNPQASSVDAFGAFEKRCDQDNTLTLFQIAEDEDER